MELFKVPKDHAVVLLGDVFENLFVVLDDGNPAFFGEGDDFGVGLIFLLLGGDVDSLHRIGFETEGLQGERSADAVSGGVFFLVFVHGLILAHWAFPWERSGIHL